MSTGHLAAVDFAVWLKAPKERTAEYFPVYSHVSRAIQGALRQWVREWFGANPDVLQRHHTAYQILVYFCTHPFRGKPTNTFTYDIQRSDMIDIAFISASYRLNRQLTAIDTTQSAWEIRERYFPYRYKEVVAYVRRNHRALYQMLHADTMLVDAVVNFAVTDIAAMGLDDAATRLRGRFAIQLARFSDEIDFSAREDELLGIATAELSRHLALKAD